MFIQPGDRRRLGRWGEQAALKFLRRAGYRIIARNFSCFLGEIDIVARKGEVVSFVEVKTRRSTRFGLPEEGVTERKKEKLAELAWVFLKKYKLDEVPCSFAVVSVLVKRERWPRKAELRLIEGAF